MTAIAFAGRAPAKIAQAHIPGPREGKRPNAHKVQLALGREIEELQELLKREHKATAKALAKVHELENRLLALEANRDGWRNSAERHGCFMELLEERLNLKGQRLSWDERREQIEAALTGALSPR